MLLICYFIYFTSSPFLCVFGDDRVILYTWADDATSDAADAWDRERG